MTTGQMEEQDIDSAMAAIWRQHRENSLARIDVIDETVATIVRGTATEADLERAVSAAHKLAGSLGTFGYEDGSRIALSVETLLREQPADRRVLAESASKLRVAVEQTPMPTDEPSGQDDEDHDARSIDAETHGADGTESDHGESRIHNTGPADVVLVSDDTELAARLIAASARAGMTCRHQPSDGGGPEPDSEPEEATVQPDRDSLVLIDSTCTTEDSLLTLVEDLASGHRVAVLTVATDFEQRLRLTRAGLVATIPRSQSPKNTIDFLSGALLSGRREPWRVCLLGVDPKLAGILDRVVSEHGAEIDHQPNPSALWKSLDDTGADLIMLGQHLGDTPAADLCRIIRAEPEHHRTPIVVYGPLDEAAITQTLEAGADDVMAVDMPAAEIQARLQRIVSRAVATNSESGLDRTTGIESRDSVERSVDRLLGLAARREEPFALARLRFDQLDAVVGEHGTVVGDLVLRRTAETIRQRFRSTDVYGRWSANELVVGFSAAGRAAAERRIEPLLAELSVQEVAAPSGRPVRCQFRWHVAIAPDDGTTLASLDRIGENAFGDGPADPPGFAPAPEAENQVDVVVIEDDDSIADVISYALGLRGYSSVRYIDGAEAAEALVGGDVSGQVVLLDVGLPSLDGFGVLSRLGSSGVVGTTHLIMLTARSSEAERLRALDLGATDHMSKPFSIPVLLGRLDQILAENQQ